MSNLASIKEKLLNKACGEFQSQVENTDFEKPPEEETFKENESTAEAVKKQLEYEAEMARVAKIAAQGEYTIKDTPKKSSVSSKNEQTETKTASSSWGGYSGYGYGGYGYSSKPTTQTESSEETLKKKVAREKAEKVIKAAYTESKNSSVSTTNIFEMAKEAEKEKELKTIQTQRPAEYKKYVAKQKGKVNIARDLLEVVKGIIEDINLYRG